MQISEQISSENFKILLEMMTFLYENIFQEGCNMSTSLFYPNYNFNVDVIRKINRTSRLQKIV